ncbi:hypothetical protein A2U01_0088143, partial [Trifolium medium]|nr:hypothetical protein [Trifolium medium]
STAEVNSHRTTMLPIIARWQIKDTTACHPQDHRATMVVIVGTIWNRGL